MKNVTIIIRSTGERSVENCKQLILSQAIDANDLIVVEEVPFSQSMKTSFRIGLQRAKKWTFCIDADLLMRPGSVSKMIELAEKQHEKTCEIQGFVMDKFFGGPRQAGNHLYRTSLLDRVIECIPEEGVNIRPERYTLGKMAEAGYPWKTVPYIVGLHDFEQYYYDIYRKAFVHAIKHLDRAELLVTEWKRKRSDDNDFNVALKAFADSIISSEEAFINSKQKLYKDLFLQTDFEEKGPLPGHSYSLTDVEDIIQNWLYSELYNRYFPDRDGLDNTTTANLNKLKRNIKTHGNLKTMKLAASEILLLAGKKMRANP